MLYLSQLLISGQSREARRDLADCHAFHQRLLHAFPDDPVITSAREHFGVLYRVESLETGARLLVQSRERPDWSRLPVGYLREPPHPPKRVDDLYARVTTGQELLFRVRANPTRRISDRDTTQAERWRGKRVELRREEEQLAWLKRKGEAAGFALAQVRAWPEVADVRTTSSLAVHGLRERTGRMTFGAVTFEGRLRITDAAIFRRTLEEGIGSGKAYGFGLLSVAPAPNAHA